jgi:hypothetical protein
MHSGRRGRAPGSPSQINAPIWKDLRWVLDHYKVHRRTVDRWRKNRKIESKQIGPNEYLYDMWDFEKLVMLGKLKRLNVTNDEAAVSKPALHKPSGHTPSTSGLLMLVVSIVVLVFFFLQPLTSFPKVNFLLWCFRIQAILFFLVSLFLFMKRRKPGVDEEIAIGVPAAKPVFNKKKPRWIFVLAGIIVAIIVFFSITKFTILTIIFVISIAQICYTWGTVKRLPVNLFSKIALWTLLIVFPLGGYGAARLVSNIKVKQLEQSQKEPHHKESKEDSATTE